MNASRFFRPRLETLEDRSVPALTVVDMTGGITPTSLVNNLVGRGVSFSNVTFQGTTASAGLFSGGIGIIGFGTGVVLSTGRARDVVGPNSASSTSTILGQPGDAQLNAIVAPSTTNDATVLQFDFVPQGNRLKFTYVFASDEYNEFVSASFNDVFAFFLNNVNVARLPGTSTAVSIDTVNLTTNRQFYRNNGDSGDPNPAAVPINTSMDGLTVVLTVNANVIPGVRNRIKLAIADTTDSSFDSNVFIQTDSFNAPRVPVLAFMRPLRTIQRGGTTTFDGIVTMVNVGNANAFGPFKVVFKNMPPGVVVGNAHGRDEFGRQFINVPTPVLPFGGTPLRFAVRLYNPLRQPLGSFFAGPFFLEVTL